MTHFFRLTIEQYEKHFDQWRTNYLLFSLVGLPLVSIYIARWILGREFVEEDFDLIWCEKYKTYVNTHDMFTYLTSKVTPSALTQQHTNLLPKYIPALKEIAEGKSVWDENVTKDMLEFKEFVENKWINVPSNTQITERWVKDSNECIVTGKSAKYARQLAMCRSATVMIFNEIVAQKEKRMLLRGNKFYHPGYRGQRISKITGELEQDTMRSKEGRFIHEVYLTDLHKINLSCQSISISADKLKEIYSYLTSDLKQFKTLQREEALDSFVTSQSSLLRNRPSRNLGIHATSLLLGRVKYTKIRFKRFIPAIREGLRQRGVTYDNKETVSALIQKLKTHETATNTNADDQHFLPQVKPNCEWLENE